MICAQGMAVGSFVFDTWASSFQNGADSSCFCVDTKRKTVTIIICPNISSRLKWLDPVKPLIATNYREYMRQNDLDN